MSGDKIFVSCPTCGKRFAWDRKSPSRPFCSDRCRLVDLGEWLDEGYKIPDPGNTKPFLVPEDES